MSFITHAFSKANPHNISLLCRSITLCQNYVVMRYEVSKIWLDIRSKYHWVGVPEYSWSSFWRAIRYLRLIWLNRYNKILVLIEWAWNIYTHINGHLAGIYLNSVFINLPKWRRSILNVFKTLVGKKYN